MKNLPDGYRLKHYPPVYLLEHKEMLFIGTLTWVVIKSYTALPTREKVLKEITLYEQENPYAKRTTS